MLQLLFVWGKQIWRKNIISEINIIKYNNDIVINDIRKWLYMFTQIKILTYYLIVNLNYYIAFNYNL